MHRKIGALFDLEVAQFQWDTPLKVVENNKAKIIWDFKFQPDAVMVNSEQKMAVIILSSGILPSRVTSERKNTRKLRSNSHKQQSCPYW